MGKSIVVLGSQWGDEGKGKVVDYLAANLDWVVRFQGGHNAGHTIVIGDDRVALNLVPSGIMNPNTLCLIAGGVVLSPDVLLKEIAMLEGKGVAVRDRLFISDQCPLLLSVHVALDNARETRLGKQAIGTTARGIGPAYEDKIARRGLRVADLYHPTQLAEKLEALLDLHNFVLARYYNHDTVELAALQESLLVMADELKPLVANAVALVHHEREQGRSILFEGAQGTLLDIDHGTYPFVTSSNTTVGGVITGTGMGPRELDSILGVTKAYCTRVGAGPMPTELHDETADYLAQKGHEIGTNTGRNRRCGWLDGVLLKKAVQLNSMTSLCLTKLDVLDELETIRLCVAYEWQGERLTSVPTHIETLAECEPIYEDFSGWQSVTAGMTDIKALPTAALNYVQRIESLVGIPIDMLSTGPRRDEMALR